MVIVSAAVGVVSWNSSSLPPYAVSTTTTTQTISCPTLNSTQTNGNSSAQVPNFGPLLGNLSTISVVENVNGSSGNFAVSASLLVLNRSFTSSGARYLVNVTMKAISSDTTVVSSSSLTNGSTTTTTTTGGNQTEVGSLLGLVGSNGSMVSVEKSSGEFAVASQQSTTPLGFFASVASLNSSSIKVLHPLNSTVVSIGSMRMLVTNYELPVTVLVLLSEGCDSASPGAPLTITVSHGAVQAGRVPGTNFTLVTLLSERIAFQSNSTSPLSLPLESITEKVTSFSTS